MSKTRMVNLTANDALAQLNRMIEAKRLEEQKANSNGMVTGLQPAPAQQKVEKIQGEEQMSPDQARAIRSLLAGKNVFLTGSAGTGKSYTIAKVKEIWEAKGLKVALTSTSGNSAVLIGGSTIHSWSGIHLCQSKDSAIKNVMKFKKPQIRINETHLLILDEISMMSANLLEVLDHVCKVVRNCAQPFGGIQVLFCGDFFQLAPVKASKYAFESELWPVFIHEKIELTQVFRQEDRIFSEALEKIRRGEVDEDTKSIFEPCIGRVFDGLIKPTELYPINEWVDIKNEDELFKLQTPQNPITNLEATDDVPKNPKMRFAVSEATKKEALAKLDKECRAPKDLLICVGAQVMLLKNLNVEAGLANGSRGVVIGFAPTGWPMVRFLNGHEIQIGPEQWKVRYNKEITAIRIQFPLKLAWAMSIHKSQGTTVDLAKVELSDRIFGDGMIYVALSRCRTLQGLCISGIDWSLVQVSKKVKEFYSKK